MSRDFKVPAAGYAEFRENFGMSWKKPTQKGELCKDIEKMIIVIQSWITNEHLLKKSAWLNYFLLWFCDEKCLGTLKSL